MHRGPPECRPRPEAGSIDERATVKGASPNMTTLVCWPNPNPTPDSSVYYHHLLYITPLLHMDIAEPTRVDNLRGGPLTAPVHKKPLGRRPKAPPQPPTIALSSIILASPPWGGKGVKGKGGISPVVSRGRSRLNCTRHWHCHRGAQAHGNPMQRAHSPWQPRCQLPTKPR